eukprot:4883654-Alexandrium_andersonii.AAC.1
MTHAATDAASVGLVLSLAVLKAAPGSNRVEPRAMGGASVRKTLVDHTPSSTRRAPWTLSQDVR